MTAVVYLSHLKIAGLKSRGDAKDLADQVLGNAQSHPPFGTTEPHPTLPKPYECLASDKPGEELAPDAGIWQLYVNEASEHDAELVKEKNSNLDVMLLFAALFSAVLAAFLIESKNLLQQDSGEITVTLLLAISQNSQIERPTFEAPASARWINGLWFTSLSLSLAAALIAMLAKEWLVAFTASRPRSARAYAHMHQKRLTKMDQWKALHIIDLLPFILHLSLLLFSLGLAVYLWTLDTAIAIAGIVVSAIVLVFYLATTVLGAIYQSCPFVTQVSKYLGVVLQRLRPRYQNKFQANPASDLEVVERTPRADLEAISWLTENSRDPAVSDCAFQALAGLRLVETTSLAFNHNEKLPAMPRTDSGAQDRQPNNSSRVQGVMTSVDIIPYPALLASYPWDLTHKLFDRICTLLHEANTHHRRDLEGSMGANVARYSRALPSLVRYLEATGGERSLYTNPAEQQSDKTTNGPARRALSAIDAVWNNKCPVFTSESYALLTAADLQLTATIASIYHFNSGLSSTYTPRQPIHQNNSSENSSLDSDDGDAELWIINTQNHRALAPDRLIALSKLQDRYRCALARVGILLDLYNNGQTDIDSYTLVYLLNSTLQAAQNSELNRWSNITSDCTAFVVDLVGTGASRSITPLDLDCHYNLLVALIKVLSGPSVERVTQVEMAAVQTSLAVGPILLQRWLDKANRSLECTFDNGYVDRILSFWPKGRRLHDDRYLAAESLGQLLCVTVLALALVNCQQVSHLADTAVTALLNRANTQSGREMMRYMVMEHKELFNLFIQTATLHSHNLSQTALGQCLQFLLIKYNEGSLLGQHMVAPEGLLDLLRLIARVPEHPLEVRSMFAELEPLLLFRLGGGVAYVSVFMHQTDGFRTLLDIAAISDYTTITLEFISDIIRVATENALKHPMDKETKLVQEAIPGLLAAVQLVIQNKSSNPKKLNDLPLLIHQVVTLISQLDTETLVHVSGYTTMAMISLNLEAAIESNAEMAGAMDEWDNLRSWAPVAGWHLHGLRELFESVNETGGSGAPMTLYMLVDWEH